MELEQILDIVRPLCDQTKNMLKPSDSVLPSDRLIVSVDGKNMEIQSKDRYLHNLISQLPTAKHGSLPNSVLSEPTDINCLVTAAYWSNGLIGFADELSGLTFKNAISQFALQLRSAAIVGKFKETGSVPEGAPQRSVDPRLMPHQRVGAYTSQLSQGYAFFNEQGTGKTAAAIAAIEMRAAKAKKCFHVLIVCPGNVRTNWCVEIDTFSQLEAEHVVVVGGKFDRAQRVIQARVSKAKWSACIVSYDTMSRDAGWLSTMQWDMIVADESHYFKANYTARWRGMKKLQDSSNSRLALTGTPVGNSVMDLWTQLEFLGEGFSGFFSFKGFRDFYGSFVRINDTDKLVGYQNLPFLHERLSRLSMQVRTDEVMTLPERTYSIVDVEMTREQKAFYERVASEVMIEVERELEESNTMTVHNILTMMLRLAQITSGFIAYDPEVDDDGNFVGTRVIEDFTPNPKLEALIEGLKEVPDTSKVIVWAVWRHDFDIIEKRLTEEGISWVSNHGGVSHEDREKARDAFNNDPNVKVHVTSLLTSSAGVNLLGNASEEHAADVVYYFSQNWSALLRDQSEKRCHRKGTKRPVKYIDLCVIDSIDFTIRQRVIDKRQKALQINDVREILGAITKCLA